jgi:hypothetical protein
MSAYFTGKMILFVCSVLWDLDIPQEAATLLYKDIDACTAMANTRKPTPHTRHMDIKYFLLSEWVERDLCGWSALITLSILQIISQRVFNRLSFIVTPTSSWATFLRHTCQFTNQLLDRMPRLTTTWTTLSLHLSLPLSLQPQLKCMLRYRLITQTVLGSPFLSMGSTIHLFPCLVV